MDSIIRKVYKYGPFIPGISRHMRIQTPYKVVLFGEQHGDLMIWVEQTVEPDAGITETIFTVYGTGWEIGAGDMHVASLVAGDFVWHLYSRMAK